MTGIPRCPVNDCKNLKAAPWHLVCVDHWNQVPKDLQDRLWAAYGRGKGAGTERHRRVINEVLALLNGEVPNATA
jgi:hypothetical protein